jgi:NADH dehydrogenase (ubiquinone) Fe-S protein 6
MLSARLAAAARLRPAFARLSSSSSSVSSSSQAVPTEAAKPIPAVVPQSPNHAATWSTNQHPRPAGQSGPRFEQTIMELQPNSLSAMELIANEPIRLIHSRKAVCDGGAGPLGHPKIYINLDKPGPQSCG